jgi:hypothetical protein
MASEIIFKLARTFGHILFLLFEILFIYFFYIKAQLYLYFNRTFLTKIK